MSSLQEVKVNRVKLLEKVKSNREKHRNEFLKAVEGYHIAMAEYLEEEASLLEEAVKESNIYKAGTPPAPPTHYLSAYDDAIAMLEWSEEETVNLENNEFKNLVQDSWRWKQEFSEFARGYNSFSDVGALKSIKYNVKKVTAPIYTMGSVDPRPMEE